MGKTPAEKEKLLQSTKALNNVIQTYIDMFGKLSHTFKLSLLYIANLVILLVSIKVHLLKNMYIHVLFPYWKGLKSPKICTECQYSTSRSGHLT